jgi:hypothetical protein
MRALLFFLPAAAFAAACTGTKDCTEWITYGSGPARSLIYRTYPLNTRNEAIKRAFIMVHGAGRDADNYFRTAVAAAFLGGALEDTMVISPRFGSNSGAGRGAGGGGCADPLAPNEVNWPCGGDSWRSGGVSTNNKELNSYDFADELLRKLARKEVFPNLTAIVVAGHSAGGQFVTRYEMANKVHDSLGVKITYVVANPSSYAYLDATRPAADGKSVGRFGDSRNCTTYNMWPYGLDSRGNGYASRIPDDVLMKQLAARPTTYLLGELDTLPLAGFDSSCPAMAQGPTRLARGQAFVNYVNTKYGAANHKSVVVPLCGHNARCMFTADPVLPIIFPKAE